MNTGFFPINRRPLGATNIGPWANPEPPEDRQRDLRDNAVEARACEIWADPELLEAAAEIPHKAAALLSRIEQNFAHATHADLVRFAAEMILHYGDAVCVAAADYVDSRAGDM